MVRYMLYVCVTQEVIQEAAGVLDTNCFELKTVTKVITMLSVIYLNSFPLPLVRVNTQPRQGAVPTGSSVQQQLSA
jgi:hypothetical protein